MDHQTSNIKIAIAGGGIAGLAFAAGLAKKHPHVDFHVYEAVEEYKDIGAGLAFHLNAIKAMMLIDPAIKDVYFDKACDMGEVDQEMATEVRIVHGPSMGEQVAELGKAKGRKTVARSDLLEGFMSIVPKERISFGKRLEHIEQKRDCVTLSFKDDTTATAHCLISAEGVHAVARRYILGPEHPATEPKNHDGWYMYRTMVPMNISRQTVQERWTKVVPILIGGKGYINAMPQNYNTRLGAGICVHGNVFDQEGNVLPLDPKQYTDYREDVQQLIRLIAQHPSPGWTSLDHDHAPTYFHGRVAMIGDAAHCTAAFNGQGAAQALEDVAVLVHLLSKLSSPAQIEAMFAAYDTIRRPRSQHVVDLSRKHGRIYGFMEGDLHERPEELRQFFKYSGSYTNGADLQQQNEDAMKLFDSKMDNMVDANGTI